MGNLGTVEGTELNQGTHESNVLFNRALEMLNRNRVTAARKDLERALQICPQHPSYLSLYGLWWVFNPIPAQLYLPSFLAVGLAMTFLVYRGWGRSQRAVTDNPHALDWLLAVPWKKKSKETRSIDHAEKVLNEMAEKGEHPRELGGKDPKA